jgi:signal transduction histidine kinase
MSNEPDPSAKLIPETELAELRRENAILRETLDTIDGTVVVYDQQRRYVLGNRAYHTHFPHLPPDHVLAGELFEQVLARSIAAGSTVDPQAASDPAAFIARRIQEMEAAGTAPREMYDRRSKNWFLLLSKLTPGGSRVTLRVNIDEQKRLQRELEIARNDAEAANRAKSLFLANMGHELRTPLNAIISFARLIADHVHGPAGDARYTEYAQSIHESGAHLLGMIEELLDLASAEAGRLTLATQAVNLRATIHSVCRMMQPAADAACVTVVQDVPSDLPAVLGDATRLRQILFNLLSNSIKFSGRDATVCVSAASVGGGGLLVKVTDTGPGIPPEDLQRLMQPFERGAAEMNRHVPGTGLGLPLVRHLIELHGGELRLESTEGAGTSASFVLPADRVIGPAA